MLSIQKLYLVYTANAIMSKCERSRKMLEISFIQIQTNVLPLLFKKISNLVEDIKSATFTLDSSEKEAGKFVHQLVHGCASESSADENFKLNVLQSALMRLHITSPKAILIEKISIKKLIKEIDDIDPKKKKILKYFLYLLKQHGNQIVAEKSEVIAEIKIEDVSSLDQSYQSKLTDQWLDSVSPENFLCAISSFLEEAIHQGNTDAQRTVLQLFLTYLKKSRYAVS
ncbi:hypothetical protein SAY86_031942 [Trapa natans]|uniref:Uncharacterized protein n=1 Tax=Trapa natans TaxID=22666 RepID=A0AAN7LTL9_TRANT|nr:hypothetical protein SAY86_031942 [Trapa natans]